MAANVEKKTIEEKIDKNKNHITDYTEIKDFILEDKNQSENIKELWEYLNKIWDREYNEIKQTLQYIMEDSEILKIFEWIGEKVKGNKDLTDDEKSIIYLSAVLFWKWDWFTNVWKFDLKLPIEKICNGQLLAYIQKRYDNYSYDPNKWKEDKRPTVENAKKEEKKKEEKKKGKKEEGGYKNPNIPNPFPEEVDEEEKVEKEYEQLPNIPPISVRWKEYIHSYCNEILKRAENNGYLMMAEYESKLRNEFRWNNKEFEAYVRYDKMLFAFQKYCEVINKKHEQVIKEAWYHDIDDFSHEMKYFGLFQDLIKEKYPDLEEVLKRLEPYWTEMEENKDKYFPWKSDNDIENAWNNFAEFQEFQNKKNEEYWITNEMIESLNNTPNTKEEAENYFKNMDTILKFQCELNIKKWECWWDIIDNYMNYILWIQDIQWKYQQVDFDTIKSYTTDLAQRWKDINFDRCCKYSSMIDRKWKYSQLWKDLENIWIISDVLNDPTGEYFPIFEVKNAETEKKLKQEKIDETRENIKRLAPEVYWTCTVLKWFWNWLVDSTIWVWTSLGAMITGLIWWKEHYQSQLQKKERRDNFFKFNQTTTQKQAVYDPQTGSLNFKRDNTVTTVSSSVAQMLCLIYWWSAVWKWITKLWTKTWITIWENVVSKAWLFWMSFITQVWQSYWEAVDSGLDWQWAFLYSMLSASVQSWLELVSPNDVLLWKWTWLWKQLINSICKNESWIKLVWTYFLKSVWREILEENLQEWLQLAAWNLVMEMVNSVWNSNFEVDWNPKNFLSTAIITTLTTWITTGFSAWKQGLQMFNSSQSQLMSRIASDKELFKDVMDVLDKYIDGKLKIPNVKTEQLKELKKKLNNIHDNPSIIQGQNENQWNESEAEDYENTGNTEDFNNWVEMPKTEYEETEDSENTEDSNNLNGMSETAHEETADNETIADDSKNTNKTNNQSTWIENDEQRQEEKSIQSTINDMTPEQQEIIKIMENKKWNLDPDDIATIKKMNLNEQQVANIKAIVDLWIIIHDVSEIWEVKDIILTPEQINNINILKRLWIENITRYDLEFTQDEIKNIEKVLNLCYEVENFIFLHRIANITETEMNNIITVAKNIKNKIKATDLLKIMESTPEQINNVIIMNNLWFIIHGEIIDDIIWLSPDEIENITRIRKLGVIMNILDINKVRDLTLTENQIDNIKSIYKLWIDINVNNMLEIINLTPYEISILKIDSENIDEWYNHPKEENEAHNKYKKWTIIENIQKYIQNTISKNRDISTEEVIREIRPNLVTTTIEERLEIINEIKESVKKFNTVRKYLDFEKWPYKTPKQLLCAVRWITDQKLITAIKDNITVKQHWIWFMFFVWDEKSYQIIYDRSTEDSGKRSGWFNTHDSEIEELKWTFSVVNWEDPNNNENNYENWTQNHEWQHNRNTEFMKDKNGSPISRAKDEIIAYLRDWRWIFKVEKRDSTIYQILTKPKKKWWLYQYGLKWNDRENHKKQVKELCTYANNLIELTKESKTWLTRDNVISMLVDTDYHNRGKLHSIIMKTVENQNNSSIEQIKNLKQEFKTKIWELAVNNRLINNLINFWNSIFQNNRIKLEEFRWAWTAEKKTVINDIENCNSLEEIKHVLNDPKYSHIWWWPDNLWWIEISHIIDEIIEKRMLITDIPEELRQYIEVVYNKQENKSEDIVKEKNRQELQIIEETEKTEPESNKRKIENSNEDYFDWQPHKYNVENMEKIAIENSKYMDNLLETINDWNMNEHLENLRKRIYELYNKVTWQELELTDEQLLSIIEAHKEEWILWKLTDKQLKAKRDILANKITDNKIIRFILEFGFCWKFIDELKINLKKELPFTNKWLEMEKKSDRVVLNEYLLNYNIKLLVWNSQIQIEKNGNWYLISNLTIGKSYICEKGNEYTIWREWNIKIDESDNLASREHLIIKIDNNWNIIFRDKSENWTIYSFVEKNENNQYWNWIEANNVVPKYKIWETVNIPRSDWRVTKATIILFNENTKEYAVERNENWQSRHKYFTNEELDTYNNNINNNEYINKWWIEKKEVHKIWEKIKIRAKNWKVMDGKITEYVEDYWMYKVERNENWTQRVFYYTQEELNENKGYQIWEAVFCRLYNWTVINGNIIEINEDNKIYEVERYENWKRERHYFREEELNNDWHYVWEKIAKENNNWDIIKWEIVDFENWKYKVERFETWKREFWYYTEEELNNFNWYENNDNDLQQTWENKVNVREKNNTPEQSINTERKEMSEVQRNSDVVAIWDLHGEFSALKWNMEYAWLAVENNWHLKRTWWNKKVVFQWDILADRWTDWLKIISEIHQLREQARLQWWNIEIVVWNHDDFMISYLTNRNGVHRDWIGICTFNNQWEWIKELIRNYYSWPIYYENDWITYDFKTILENWRENILNNMRNSPEWRIILEEICNMNVVTQVDDVLYCHTNPSKEMLKYLTKWNIQDNISNINRKYQWYLRNILLWEWNRPISTREFNDISDMFLDTDNRYEKMEWIEKYCKMLKDAWINMISHWHSWGDWYRAIEIWWVRIVDTDHSYMKYETATEMVIPFL